MLASIIALVGVFAVTAFGSLIRLDRQPVQAAAAA
jgi:hypothetical protein